MSVVFILESLSCLSLSHLRLLLLSQQLSVSQSTIALQCRAALDSALRSGRHVILQRFVLVFFLSCHLVANFV